MDIKRICGVILVVMAVVVAVHTVVDPLYYTSPPRRAPTVPPGASSAG